MSGSRALGDGDHPSPAQVAVALDPALDATGDVTAGPPRDPAGHDDQPVRADVLRHLDRCARCADVAEGLLRLHDLFGSAPAPELPPAVVSRLQEALAAEAGRRAQPWQVGETDGRAGGHGVRVLPLPTAATASRARRHTSRTRGLSGVPGGPRVRAAVRDDDRSVVRQRRGTYALACAAALVLLSGAVAIGTDLLRDGDDGSSSLTAADGSARQEGSPAELAVPAVTVLATGTDYTADGLAAQVSALLAAQEPAAVADAATPEVLATPDTLGTAGADTSTDTSTGTSTGTSAGTGAPTAPAAGAPAARAAAEVLAGTSFATAESIAGCMEALGAPGVEPLAVDIATYLGQQAALVVLPGRGGEGVEVWAVARSCAPGEDGTIAFRSLTPP